jgi:hypothetical protein
MRNLILRYYWWLTLTLAAVVSWSLFTSPPPFDIRVQFRLHAFLSTAGIVLTYFYNRAKPDMPAWEQFFAGLAAALAFLLLVMSVMGAIWRG